MRATLLAGSLIFTLFSTGCIIDAGANRISVYNDSSFEIDVIRVRELGSIGYGSNYLGSPLRPRGSLTIVGLPCGTYDLLVQDELGTQCELLGQDLCFGGREAWRVSDSMLTRCAFRRF
jgi:hypothetical protein